MRVRYTNIVAQCMDTPQRRMFDLRQDGLPEIPLLGWQCYAKARPDLPLHRHSGCLEIHFLERGEQPFQIGDRLYRLRGGDLFVNLPDETHSTGGHPCGPGVMNCILVRLPKRGRGFLGLSANESRLLVDRLLKLPDRQFRANREIKRLFGELIRLHDRPDSILRKSSMRWTAAMLLLNVLDSADRHTRSQASLRMAEVIQAIRERPEAEFCLKDLARRTHLSLPRFKGRFKAETGIPPWQFILHTKVEAAQRRLRNGSRSITQIAMELGFVSSQYFATVFKRVTGITPRAYRQLAPLPGPSTRRDDGQG